MIWSLVASVMLLIVSAEAGSGSCNYQCPQHSDPRPNRDCYNNIHVSRPSCRDVGPRQIIDRERF